jgi:uncharacterized protein
MEWLSYVGIGLLAGVFGGMFGVGGGIVMVPAMVLLLGFSQHKAQGTSLAVFMLPVAFLGFLNYYRKGEADLVAGLIMAAGVAAGMFAGSKLALAVDQVMMRKVFAIFLVLVAVQLFLKK